MREQIREAPPEEQIQTKLDIIKKCLNIDSIEEMNMLFESLDEHEKKLREEKKKIEEGEKEEEEVKEGEGAKISDEEHPAFNLLAIYISKIMQEFMETKTERKEALRKFAQLFWIIVERKPICEKSDQS